MFRPYKKFVIFYWKKEYLNNTFMGALSYIFFKKNCQLENENPATLNLKLKFEMDNIMLPWRREDNATVCYLGGG